MGDSLISSLGIHGRDLGIHKRIGDSLGSTLGMHDGIGDSQENWGLTWKFIEDA
jgi:hypothetical protein